MIESNLCVLFLIPHKGNWKLFYWRFYVSGTLTCKVFFFFTKNKMLLADASVYTHFYFILNQSLEYVCEHIEVDFLCFVIMTIVKM